MDAQKKYHQAIEAAWQQRMASINLGAPMSEVEQAYLTKIEVAKAEYRKVYPEIVQPSGVD